MSTSPLRMSAEYSSHQHQNVYILPSSDLEQLRQYIDKFVLIVTQSQSESQRELASFEATRSTEWQKSALEQKCRILACYRQQLTSLQHNPYPTVEDFSNLTTILDGLALQSAERLHQVSRSTDTTTEEISKAQEQYMELATAITSPGYSVILKDPANPMQAVPEVTAESGIAGIDRLDGASHQLREQFSARIAELLSPVTQQPSADTSAATTPMPDDAPNGPLPRIYPPSQQT